jgi:DNA-binding IclR family transcriptional regulator
MRSIFVPQKTSGYRTMMAIHSMAHDGKEAGGSFARAQMLLRAIAQAGTGGAPLRHMIQATGLPRPTVHRVLSMLEAAGWVARSADGQSFRLGLEVLALGAGAAACHPLGEVAGPPMARLALAIAQPIYLVVRAGPDSVCVAREESGRRIQTLVLQVGSREPLGIGAGSMALLAALPEDEMQDFIAANRDRYRQRPDFDEAAFLAAVERTRARGFAEHDDLFTPGVSGVGVAVRDGRGAPIAGISTAFVGLWLSADERAGIVPRMRAAADEISARLRGVPEGLPNR